MTKSSNDSAQPSNTIDQLAQSQTNAIYTFCYAPLLKPALITMAIRITV
jgi:hypothetical protein